MRLSHSKLNAILSCPMSYYLNYKQGIRLKTKKQALLTGGDVHWGLEHATDDLEQYYIDDGRYKKGTEFSREQVLAEAMVHGFLHRKQAIFDNILHNPTTNTKLELVEELHELTVTAKLKSYSYDVPHEFLGIIDLLLLVKDEDGKMYFIVLDYKTSSSEPDWNDYLDQIYRYVFLIQSAYPEVPVLKVGIINLIKSKTKWMNGENEKSFASRIKREYELSDDLITYHEYPTDSLDATKMSNYLFNLSKKADAANAIELGNIWFINYDNAINKYGKTDYYDILYRTAFAHVLYEIKDEIYDVSTKTIKKIRDCVAIDMLVIDHSNVLNKYEQFKAQSLAYYSIHQDIDKETFFADLKKSFTTDDTLLELYWNTLLHEVEEHEKK